MASNNRNNKNSEKNSTRLNLQAKNWGQNQNRAEGVKSPNKKNQETRRGYS